MSLSTVTAPLTGEAKRSFVQGLFTSIAPRYDWFNRIASCGLDQYWRKRTIEHAQIEAGMNILDVCAGTGDLALLASKVMSEGSDPSEERTGRVVGIDMNAAMLTAAREKNSQIGWYQGDAQRLPFNAGFFDRVVNGFSTRNLSDLSLGVAEMVRVLTPGFSHWNFCNPKSSQGQKFNIAVRKLHHGQIPFFFLNCLNV